jgi:hypothetical protein
MTAARKTLQVLLEVNRGQLARNESEKRMKSALLKMKREIQERMYKMQEELLLLSRPATR